MGNPKQIPLKYQTTSDGRDFGSYHQLDWSFEVSNEGDAMCCPSSGEVSGTYKIVKDATNSPPTWKMVVDTAKRQQVYVEGRLTTREYEAKNGSGKR